MRLFVTGASGLVGRHLVREAARRGHEVVALSRAPRPAQPHVTWVRGELPHVSAWQEALDGVDAIVNLAGEPIAAGRWTRARRSRIVASRVGMTTALHEAIGNAKVAPHAMVSASAVGYYGATTGHADDLELDEQSPRGEGFLARVCEEWEAAAVRCRSDALPVTRLRLGVVLAPEGGMLGRLATPMRWFLGGTLGPGTAWLPWIHIDDVVAMIFWALERRLDGAVNAVAPEAATQRAFVRMLADTLHRPTWLDAPAPVLRLALGALADEVLLGGQRVVPRRALTEGFAFTYPDLRTALRACLGGGAP